VLVLEEKLFDELRHGNVKGAGIVIPIQLDATVQVARPIFGEFIFLFDAPNEMVHMFFTNIRSPQWSASTKPARNTPVSCPSSCPHTSERATATIQECGEEVP
jgi:hypothetical protein